MTTAAPNPIFDNGSPRSFGGILSAAKLADALGVELIVAPPDQELYHAWGPAGSEPSLVIGVFTLVVRDVAGKPCAFRFELIDGDAPLLVGEDVQSRGVLHNLDRHPHFVYRPPGSQSVYVFEQYAGSDIHGDRRRFLSVVQDPGRVLSAYARAGKSFSLHSVRLAEADPRKLAVRLHHFSHATVDEMRRIVQRAGIYQPEMEQYFTQVVDACTTCPKTGSPLAGTSVRKVSFRRVLSEDFGREVQMDYLYFDARGTQHCYLHIVDADTSFGELIRAESRDLSSAADSLERHWIYVHGAPRSVGADPEFGRQPFLSRIAAHGVEFSVRPARRHNTVGIVERRNRQIKILVQRLVSGDDDLGSHTSLDVLLARANFLANLFTGSGLASSFERVRGYSPSLLGMPSSWLPDSILRAHRSLVAARALSRMLRSRAHHTLPPSALSPGTAIHAYVRHKNKMAWREHAVVSAEPHVVRARAAGTTRGPISQLSYHDVRLVPQHPLAAEFIAAALASPVAQRQGGREDETRSNAAGVPEDDGDAGDHESVAESPEVGADGVDRGGTHDGAAGAGAGRDSRRDPDAAALSLAFQSRTADTGDPARDIGTTPVLSNNVCGELASDAQHLLRAVKSEIGGATVTRKHLEFAPPWLLEQAFATELKNWSDVIESVPLSDLRGTRANCIRSHTLYKVKEDENHRLTLKCRLVPNGNLDRDKESVRKDSAAVQFPVIRLIISLASLWQFHLGVLDVKAAYMQSGPMLRKLYVYPPAEYTAERGHVWRLLKLPYGVTEAGRQWQLVVESWLLSESMGFTQAVGFQQLFVKRDEGGSICLLLGKLVDDFLVAGIPEHIHDFFQRAKARFDISKAVVADKLCFNGCEIHRHDDGSYTLSMAQYVADKVYDIDITRARNKERDQLATDEEKSAYRHLAGVLAFLGQGTLPQAAYCSSALLQRLPRLAVSDLVVANDMVRDLALLRPVIHFAAPRGNVVDLKVMSFSDAAFNVAASMSYGQSGVVSGILIKSDEGETLYHGLQFHSGKQRRVVYSSFGAEIIACAEADDRGYALKNGLSELLDVIIEHELSVDSHGLFDTITTLHDSKEYRLRQTVQRIRDSFESRELDVLRWIRGFLNVADALTKRNPDSWRRLNTLLSEGIFNIDLQGSSTHGDEDGWRAGLTLAR